MENGDPRPPFTIEEVAYPGVRQRFRGPAAETCGPFIAVLGGSEVYAKHLARPFSQVLAELTGRAVANLGCMNGGLTTLESSHGLLSLAARAETVVVQITGAHQLSNRLYMVHSRRNDRFLSASPQLESLFPRTDFTDFSFVGHLLTSLRRESVMAFEDVKTELRGAWVHRMREIIGVFECEVVLLWMSTRPPEGDEMADPAFVTRQMLVELAGTGATLVEVVDDGSCDRTDTPSASSQLPQALHDRAGAELAKLLAPVNHERPQLQGAHVVSMSRPGQSFSVSSGTASKRSATRP